MIEICKFVSLKISKFGNSKIFNTEIRKPEICIFYNSNIQHLEIWKYKHSKFKKSELLNLLILEFIEF